MKRGRQLKNPIPIARDDVFMGSVVREALRPITIVLQPEFDGTVPAGWTATGWRGPAHLYALKEASGEPFTAKYAIRPTAEAAVRQVLKALEVEL